MKLPSLQHLATGFNNVVKRFPVQFIITILATIGWCYIIQLDRNYSAPYKTELLKTQILNAEFSLNIALVLTFALDLFSERNHFTGFKKWGLRLAALAFCTLIYCVLAPTKYMADAFKIAMLSFAFHLLVSFAPFIGKKDMNGFWQFNKVLFLRILTAALYSAVLFAGLAAALAAIDNLFNVHVMDHWYATMFAIIAVGFNTIFFLAGIPKDIASLNDDNSYPKGLKIFTQFVLIPLMTIYLAILLVYEVKIAVTWQMPKGMVSVLILGYAVFGILSLLLIHPIKETEGNNWIKLFSRFFYLMMIPLIVLLILAIWKRVGHYGITESRYVLIVLALWLSGITLYFILSKKQNIKVIPVSLCIITLLSIYGPQSAFSVSAYSQLARLKKLYKSTNKNDKAEVTEIVEYMVSHHGLQSLQSFTKTDLKSVEGIIDKRNAADYSLESTKEDTAFAILKLSKTYPEITDYAEPNLTFINPNKYLLNVKGYDFMFPIDSYNDDYNFNGKIIKTKRIEDGHFFVLDIDTTEVIKINVMQVFKDAMASYKRNELVKSSDYEFFYPTEKMTFKGQTADYEFTIILTQLSGKLPAPNSQDQYSWVNAEKYLLIRKL